MPRIIAGKHRGRKLASLAGGTVRPTSGRAREAVFNILAHAGFTPRPPYEDAFVLDAFAGSGALGLEALSRGARFVTFMERDRTARAVLAANIAALGAERQTTVLTGDALRPPRANAPASLAFLDPPYAEDWAAPALAALAASGWLQPDSLAVVELPAKRAFAPPVRFTPLDERRYGAAKIVFLRYSAATAAG
ncbi:MAG: 16S rRNA (guanine(966)-N(2))-methyltransferase RsmD [Alphaproteobacteria bacterium]|nr:16S rRNA (guanine(966)-N(2))-methyltransferase RsmD [Alphaproteobacteria bacterium]